MTIADTSPAPVDPACRSSGDLRESQSALVPDSIVKPIKGLETTFKRLPLGIREVRL